MPPLLKRETHPDNCLLVHQVPCNLCPGLHSRLPRPRCPAPLNMHAQPVPTLPRLRKRCGSWRWSRRRLLRLGDELRPTHAAVPLPRRLRRGTAGAIHRHALGSGRDIHNLPVARGAVIRLAMPSPRINSASEVLRLLARRVPEWRGGVRATPSAVVDA